MVRAKNQYAATLVVAGLWKQRWDSRISDFEHDPRLVEVPEDQREATRLRWVEAATEDLKKRGFGTPRERRDAGDPVIFRRYLLPCNTLVAEHASVADRSIKSLAVDHYDVVTASEDGP